ncbi:hypothetical protein OG728_39355 (plasmid) [Streptomyces microflavus]|uniref:hypothetical protein n=1 Tax=Streptomyces microflavus TaxID=1919 RepID=UPI002E167E44|nr:hypothetical protein OG728_39355 [Streptomyces microflavus]
MPMFNSTHDLCRALHSAGLFHRLGTVLDGFETTRQESLISESRNFTCTHPGTCTACPAGRVAIHPRPGTLSVTVPSVSGDRWKTALGAIVPEPGRTTPAVRDPFALGPLDGVTGWQRLTAFVPDTTVAHTLLDPGISARTDFRNHAVPGQLVATLSITPAARDDCEPAWDQGLRFLAVLTSAEPAQAVQGT